MTASRDSGQRGVLLWVTAEPSAESRELVTAVAREFGRTARFCSHEEMAAVVSAGGVDVVGLELGSQPETASALLEDFRRRMPRVTLFAASANGSVAMIRAALSAGASDFLSLPLGRSELHKALIKFAETPVQPRSATPVIGDVITIYGARGGLGATTIAVNLAVRIASLTGENAALVDLDLQRGDIAAFLNLAPAHSLAALAAAPGEVDELFLYGMLTRHPSGVFVLPAPDDVEEADGISGAQVSVALRLLRSRFRYTIVDTARSLTDATLAAFEQTERLLVLTDLSVPGVRAARRVLELLRRLETPIDRVEILVTEAVPGPVKMEDAARALGKEPFAIVAGDREWAGQAMNAGAPLNGVRESALAASMTELAAKLTGVAPPQAGSGGLLGRLFGRGRRDRA